jgi:hypothetical protein
MREQHAAQIPENLLGAQLLQTVQMTKRTLALKTGAAFEMKPLYLRKLRQGRRMARIR